MARVSPIIILFLLAAFGFSIYMIYKIPPRMLFQRVNDQPEEDMKIKKELSKLRYVEGLGIQNSGTFYEGLEPQELWKRCKRFGKECLAFDTLGNLFLYKDRNRVKMNQLNIGYAPDNGVYINDTDIYETTCRYFNKCAQDQIGEDKIVFDELEQINSS